MSDTPDQALSELHYANLYEQQVKANRKLLFLLLAVILVAVAVITVSSWSVIKSNRMVAAAYVTAAETVESNRQSLLQGMYSINRAIESDTPTRSKRLEILTIRAKAAILDHNPETDFTDDQLNDMLIMNFNLSEQYMIDFWIPLAFGMIESDYTVSAESVTGARGWLQFIPSTARLVMGEDYRPGVEFNPLELLRAWYRYYLIISELFNGDLKWSAAYYLNGTSAYRAYATGMSLEDYTSLFTDSSINHVDYPWRIERAYNDLKAFTTY